mgnify:FL=1
MKNILILVLSVFLTHSVYSQTCEDCIYDNQISVSVVNGNVFASSNFIAQAYYWEICSGSSMIIGSNTSQTIQINYNGESTLKLTRFENGECSVTCIDLNSGNCSDSCCAPDLDLSFICRPNGNGGGAIWFENPSDCSVDWGSISSIDVSVSGAFLTRSPYYGQYSGTYQGPFTDGNWVLALATNDGCPRSIRVTMTFHFNNGCQSITKTIRHLVENFDLLKINEKDYSANIYPNPATENIKITGKNINNSEIFIYNSKGILEIHEQNISKEINISKLSNGIYYYNIIENNEIIKKGKIIKE